MRFEHEGKYYSVYKSRDIFLPLDGTTYQPRLTGREDKSVSLETDLPTLYKQDKKGRWQTLTFRLICTKDPLAALSRTIETEGLKTREWVAPIKRVNSKHYSDVVQERLQAAWKKKKDRDGWVENKLDLVVQEPMLLHHYDKDKVTFPLLISPKLNGVRAVYLKNKGLYSRKRNKFEYLQYIKEELGILGMNVDGELWHPLLDLEDIVSVVKGGAPVPPVQYHIFEAPSDDPSYPRRLAEVMRHMPIGNFEYLKVVPVLKVNNEEELKVAKGAIKEMYPKTDGLVARTMDCKYEWDSRSWSTLKIKDEIEHEFIVERVHYDEDTLGKLIVLTFGHEGLRFKYVPAWSKEERKSRYEAWECGADVYEGRIYTLTFREWTKKGLPKHIMGLQERNYE